MATSFETGMELIPCANSKLVGTALNKQLIVMQLVSQFMAISKVVRWKEAKRIIRFMKGGTILAG